MYKYLWPAAAIAGLFVADAAAGNYPSHQGTSPFNFDIIKAPSGSYVVNDTDSTTIDQYMFNDNGDIVINVPIRRYVGPVDSEGYLIDAQGVKEKGLVEPQAYLHLPAWDVDRGRFVTRDCDADGIEDNLDEEINEVFFNGEKVGVLLGTDGVWHLQRFAVDVSKLRFPAAPGGVGVNELRVKIDTGNRDIILSSGRVGCRQWATTIDWVGIEFAASAPVGLVHGMNAQDSQWDGLKQVMQANQIVADSNIYLPGPARPETLPLDCGAHPYNQSISYNIPVLRQALVNLATTYGTGKINLIAHGKGGIESYALVNSFNPAPVTVQVGTMGGQPVMETLSVPSLTAINPPFKGSVLAKLGVEARKLALLDSYQSSDAELIEAAKSLEGSYYCDMTPTKASQFSDFQHAQRNYNSVFASVATNADRNGDYQINAEESTGVTSEAIGNKLYRLVGGIGDVMLNVTTAGDPAQPDSVTVLRRRSDFFTNSLIVHQDSTWGFPPLYHINSGNHATDKAFSAQQIIDAAFNPNFATRINWSKK